MNVPRDRRWWLLLAAGCSGGRATHSDAPVLDAAVDVSSPSIDAPVDAPPDAAQMVRVYGNVNFNGGVQGVQVMTLGASPQTTTTDANGDFYFDVIQGSRLIVEAVPPSNGGLIPMIRGVVAEDHLRPRVFYLLGPPDVAAANSLGVTVDPAKAIVETDFRNAAIGGYGVTLTSNSQTVVPGYGIVFDDSGNPVLGEQTVTGGDGSTLLLGGLPATNVSFTPIVPQAATLPCHPDDADPLPLLPGVATWFDFECGNGTD